jgi:hypothetical protein
MAIVSPFTNSEAESSITPGRVIWHHVKLVIVAWAPLTLPDVSVPPGEPKDRRKTDELDDSD